MRKMLIVLLSSAAIGAGAIATATPAAAFWPLLIPMLIGAGAGGVVTGAAVATAPQPPPATVVTTAAPAPDAPAPVYGAPAPAPAPGCTFSRRWVNGAWRMVQICD